MTVDARSGDGRRDGPGTFAAPVVVDVAGRMGRRRSRRPSVSTCPIQPWRHDTGLLRRARRPIRPTFRSCIDNIGGVYFRPEGRDLMLVGLEAGSEVGGSPDRPLRP